MVAISSFALAGFSAVSIDIGNYMLIRQRLQNALDAAALAGAQSLPFDQQGAERLAREFADHNGLEPSDIEPIRFGCLVDVDKEQPGTPEKSDVASLCRRYENRLPEFKCDATSCYRACEFDPTHGSTGCNTIRISATRNVQPFLASLVGFTDPLVARLEGAACRGLCGTPPELDVVMILDRTESLSAEQFENVRDGARSVLDSNFIPELHRFALAMIPPDPARQGDHLLSDLLPSDDQRLRDIIENEIVRAGSDTNLANPVRQAVDLLTGPQARDGATRQIVLLTDGVSDSTQSNPTCEDAFQAAQRADQAGIRVFTIGYFRTESDGKDKCSSKQEAANWQNVEAHELLVRMAVGSVDAESDFPDCGKVENDDGDDFFCAIAEGEAADGRINLTNIFNRIIQEILTRVGSGSSLVDLSAYNRAYTQ